jgi:multidrug resistance protein MdtO
VTAAALVDFLRRELAPTPGRGGATLRLTLACLIATIPILTHRMPLALLVLIIMYLVTQEDTATTLLGSVLGVVGVTIAVGVGLLALMVALDVAWLRIACFVAFLFVGLFLKRVLVIGAFGSAIGLPAAILMMLPDLGPLSPESLVEFALWLWTCTTLGLSINLGVQLLLSPADPLTLLQRELDTRLRSVEDVIRALVDGRHAPSTTTSLDAFATAGMSQPLALLKSASLTNARARAQHETLAALITLADRLVTDAAALRLLVSPQPDPVLRAALERVADSCALARRALVEQRWPEAARAAASDRDVVPLPPLADMERTLEQLEIVVRVGPPRHAAKEAPRLLVPDATTNPEYVQFAAKGTIAALICYILFVGFDYPGIYTSVITCFVCSLSTIGSSNQKGLLRFGGAVVGGVMGLFALVYAFPNIDGLGGFWLVFGAGTAVAAWINFGSPRISYGGYQTGLAFYKATLQGFGASLSATVIRDRLIGIAFGLIVFGVVEHLLWPVRAADRMRARLADLFRALAAFAHVASRPRDGGGDVGACCQLISQQVTDVQGFIESSKFELSDAATDPQVVARLTADAQTVFLVLLAIARDAEPLDLRPDAVRTKTIQIDDAAAAILEGLAERVDRADASPAIAVDDLLADVERSIAGLSDAQLAHTVYAGTLVLYRELAVAIQRVATSESFGTKCRRCASDRS